MKKKYLLAIFLALVLGLFGVNSQVRAESGSGDSGDSTEVEDSDDNSGSDDDSDSEDDNSDDSNSDDNSDESDDSNDDVNDDSNDDANDDSNESDDSGVDGDDDSNDDKGGLRPKIENRFMDREDRPAVNPFLKKMGERETILDKFKENSGKGSLGSTVSEIRKHIGSRLEVAGKNLDNFIIRLDERLTKIEDSGRDVANQRALLDEAKDAVEGVHTAVAENKALIESETATKEEVKAAAEEVKLAAGVARDAIKIVIESMKESFAPSVTEDEDDSNDDSTNS